MIDILTFMLSLRSASHDRHHTGRCGVAGAAAGLGVTAAIISGAVRGGVAAAQCRLRVAVLACAAIGCRAVSTLAARRLLHRRLRFAGMHDRRCLRQVHAELFKSMS